MREQFSHHTIIIFRVIFVYALFSVLWVSLGDIVLFQYIPDDVSLEVSIIKGVLFVVISSVLIYFLLNYAFSRLEMTEEELRRSQQELQHIDAKLEFLMNQLPVVFWEIDANGIIKRIFGKNTERLMYSTEEIEGTSIFELYKGFPEVVKKAREVLEGKKLQWQFELRERYYENYYEPIFGENDEVTGALGLGIDITNTTTMKKELLATQKSLLAIHRLDLLGTVLGKVTHDLNNHFTLITGYMHLLSEDFSERRLENYFPKLQKSVDQASDLLSNLQSYTREGKYDKLIPLKELFENLQPMLNFLSNEFVTLNYYLDEELYDHEVSKLKVEAIITNLLSNAVDALEDGKGFVSLKVTVDTLETHDHSTKDECLMIEVSDTGTGIPSSILSQIFDPLFSTKSKEMGTGLGLSIVADMIKSLNGYIDVDTNHSGTTMRVYLPIDTKIHDTDKEVHQEAIYKVPSSQPNVVLIDDNQSILEFIESFLSPYSNHIHSFTDSLDALNELSHTKNIIDIFIVDVVMPDFDGISFAKKIRDAYPDSSFIFISGYRGMELIISQVPNSVFLHKPFYPAELLHTIAISLEN